MTSKIFKISRLICLTGILALLLAACLPGTPQPVLTLPPTIPAPIITPPALTFTPPAMPPTPAPSATTPPTDLPPTAEPTATLPPLAPSPTTPPAPTRTSVPAVNLPAMLDDRSTPTGLILSYFNAINRKEYLRAYAYYTTPSKTAGTFATFFAGYQNTASVAVAFGTVGGDNGAGQIYYSVPALLTAVSTSGATTNFAACYILHLSQPGVQGAPPFAPLSINLGKAVQLANNADSAAAQAAACSGPDFPQGQPINPAPQTNTQDISQNNYLDERSDARNVIKSLLNAINRKEYVRAYSYWQNSTVAIGPYAAYEKGFADTASVEATFGTVIVEIGEEELIYRVPLAEKVKTTSGGTQTFVGCYTLQIFPPEEQIDPPYIPLTITKGSLKQVDNSTNTQPMLATACTRP